MRQLKSRKERSLTTLATFLFDSFIGPIIYFVSQLRSAVYTIFELRNDFHVSSVTRKLISNDEENEGKTTNTYVPFACGLHWKRDEEVDKMVWGVLVVLVGVDNFTAH